MTESDIEAVATMHAVYKMWSASGVLLYVGVTSDLSRRLDTHTEKRWYPLVAKITLTWFADRIAAEEAEAEAIATERPRLNVAGKTKPKPWRPPRSLRMSPGMPPEGAPPITLAQAVQEGPVCDDHRRPEGGAAAGLGARRRRPVHRLHLFG